MTEEKRQLLKKDISEIMKDVDRERASDIKHIVKCVKEKEGENGFNDLVKELAKYDFKLPDVKKLGPMEWAPRFLPRIFLIGAIYFFDWTEEEVFNMGKKFITYSKPIKIFMKWFSSTKSTIEKIAKDWNKYYTHGSASIKEFNENKKYSVLEIKDFDIHPLTIMYFEGIFTKILEIATGSKKVEVKEFENKDNHKYHKFKAKW
jgi:hypothetical protein